MKKIILGSAQFRMKYSLFQQEKINKEEIQKIINFAKNNGINTIDTANSYADTEKTLGNLDISDLDVISKFTLDFNLDYHQIDLLMERTLKHLNQKKIYGILFHESNQLFSDLGKKVFQRLQNFKNKELISNIGVSVYSVPEAIKIIDNFDIDILQAPVSILDRRFLDKKIIDIINKKNIIFHARSIFLQGLLLNKNHLKIKYFDQFNFIFDQWFDWLEKNNLNPISECLKFVYNNINIQKVIIGINNYNQLKEIKSIFDSNFSKIDIPNFLVCNNEKLINPHNWNKN